MGVHAYCVVPSSRQPAGALRGVDGAQVRAVTAGTVELWISSHERAPTATVDAARQHHDVVLAAMDRESTPVPIRFGQWFDTEREAAAAIADDNARWQTLLDQFAGHVEYGVRLGPPNRAAREMHPAPAESGTAYMAALARRAAVEKHHRREVEQLAELLSERAGSMLADSRIVQESGGSVSIAHLLAWSDVIAYHSIVNEARDAAEASSLMCTGPWPPYSFVE